MIGRRASEGDLGGSGQQGDDGTVTYPIKQGVSSNLTTSRLVAHPSSASVSSNRPLQMSDSDEHGDYVDRLQHMTIGTAHLDNPLQPSLPEQSFQQSHPYYDNSNPVYSSAQYPYSYGIVQGSDVPSSQAPFPEHSFQPQFASVHQRPALYPPQYSNYHAPPPPSAFSPYSPQIFYEPSYTSSSEFSVETMHGMPSYAFRPPITRSSQTSPLNPSPPYPHQTPNQQPFSRPNTGQTQSGYSTWTSPPMSPVLGSQQQPFYGNMGSRGHHSRQGSFVDEFGQGRRYGPPSSWNSPAQSSPYGFMTPFQSQSVRMEPGLVASDGWGGGSSPAIGSNQHGSWQGYPKPTHNHRTSWSGRSHPLQEESRKEVERKNYHPQAPPRRSDWVMWVGNVPSNVSHEELWRFFNSNIPELPNEPSNLDPWLGPSSIFLISRSSCAFVNLSSQVDLDRAVAYFNGRPLRPWDSRCPRMVCRIRKKDDDLRAGVGGQRGMGMHREWVKDEQRRQPEPASIEISETPISIGTGSSSVPPSPAVLEHPPDGDGRRRESLVLAQQQKDEEIKNAESRGQPIRHASTASFASTNSSFLTKHFPKRVFILKSLTLVSIEIRSELMFRPTCKKASRLVLGRRRRTTSPFWVSDVARTSLNWVDQAFRTSQEVFLIFGANRSGEFFGYAKMIEPINKEKAAAEAASRSVSWSSKVTNNSSSGSGSGSVPSKHKSQPQPARIREEDEDERPRAGSNPVERPTYLLSPSQPRVATSSPGELTPNEEAKLTPHALGERKTDPGRQNLDAQAALRSNTLDPRALRTKSYFPPVPIAQSMLDGNVERQQALGGSSRQQDLDDNGILRKDTILSPEERKKRTDEKLPPGGEQPDDGESWGQPFRIEWVRVSGLVFSRTKHLRNPWNSDREVKISRDGTEVEPTVGALLMAEWDKPEASAALPPRFEPTSPPGQTRGGELPPRQI
ncbi:hypothetical protein P7C73_g1732, partial [Tremellales sp. Uapishka_1]